MPRKRPTDLAALPSLRLDEQLCFPLYAASNLMTRLYRPLLDQLGLTYPQYLVMLVLWEESTCSVGGLGERLMLDTGTLTPLLKRLESAGLVRRQRDTNDERRVLVSLDTEGAALKARASGVPQALACRVLGNVSPDPGQLRQLRACLQGLVQALSHALDQQPVPATRRPPSRAKRADLSFTHPENTP